MTRYYLRSSAAVLLATLATCGLFSLESCSSPQEPSDTGYLEVLADVSYITIPDTIHANERFIVSIHTWTPDPCWKQGRDVVERIETGYHITPYNLRPAEPYGCVLPLGIYVHEVPLTFKTPGVFQVLISHRLLSSTRNDSIGTIFRQVVTLPGTD